MNTETSNAYAIGERVFLRALTEEDAEGPWHTWFSDENVMRYVGYWRPNSIAKQKAFFRSRVEESGDLILAVIHKSTGRHIGVVSLSAINWVHRFADIAIIIGDKFAQSEAVLGFEAFSMMLKIGFLRLNLENIKGGYVAGQEHSSQILAALRFREIGRVTGLFSINGEKCDHVLVQLSREDWMRRNPTK